MGIVKIVEALCKIIISLCLQIGLQRLVPVSVRVHCHNAALCLHLCKPGQKFLKALPVIWLRQLVLVNQILPCHNKVIVAERRIPLGHRIELVSYFGLIPAHVKLLLIGVGQIFLHKIHIHFLEGPFCRLLIVIAPGSGIDQIHILAARQHKRILGLVIAPVQKLDLQRGVQVWNQILAVRLLQNLFHVRRSVAKHIQHHIYSLFQIIALSVIGAVCGNALLRTLRLLPRPFRLL